MASIKTGFYLLLFLTTFTYSRAKLCHLKKTEMILYYQNYSGDQNTTTVEIPVPSTGPLDFTKFGAAFCTDDPITEVIKEGSSPIARSRGIYIISSLDGSQAQMIMSIIFINGKYKGSTLEMQGSYEQSEKVSEVAVVGGTGKFRLARGYVTFKTLYYDPVRVYSATQTNITVLHY
ncbi:dirigent protein 22-like [Salvia divinorum]|uniref:Dirigent protein n=1 Tax=Salvia divinorum TaxID=28513 RepID=A0ABD1IFX7_SALDI